MLKKLHKPNTVVGRAAVRARFLGFTAIGLTLAVAPFSAQAADPAPAKGADVSEVVVNGVPYKETVLPTRLPATSTYGLNISIMDTPRSATLLSTTQLATVNLTDPRAFSYLTSSSYTDSAFGTPNIPRVRTQYADVYYNGMRDSFTENGYGVPINFDALANVSITKGPASVVNGVGPGNGGQVDFLTKRPNMSKPTALVEGSVDSVGNHRWLIDAGGPIIPGELAAMFSYSGADSGSYFYGHYFRKNAVYAAVRWQPNDKYKLDFNTEVNVEQYTENVGVNRANQNLIDHHQYLLGGTGDPALNFGFGSIIDLAGTVKLNPRITIDQTNGTSGRARLYNAQLIQTYDFNDHLSIENNTLFMWQDSDNQALYYYADNSNGTYSIESKTSIKGDFDVPLGFGKDAPTFNNQFIAGGTFRFAHTNYISNFNNEAVSIWDLTTDPNSWRIDPAGQTFGDAGPYKSVFGRTQYGVLGRDFVAGGNTGVSDLYDTGLFFQDRMEFSPKFSVLFGARIDALQDRTHDPLECTPEGISGDICADFLPKDHTTGVYGLGNGNVSAVYKILPNITSYVTFNWTQAPPNPNGGEGGINAYGFAEDGALLRGNGFLWEGGFKFDLLNKKLFATITGFDQKHYIPVGAGNTSSAAADTRGVEVELNYQPTRSLYATASYSYTNTQLNTAPAFYDFPAQPGLAIDGSGLVAVFKGGQHFDDPGQPQHVLNFLGNYKFENGFGLRTGLQVTGPIELTPSGFIDVAASDAKAAGLFGFDLPFGGASIIHNQLVGATNAAGYYKSPTIPWQYTWNASVFYESGPYTLTFSVYNLTDQKNWAPSLPFYGTDFLVLSDPRTFELRLQAKF